MSSNPAVVRSSQNGSVPVLGLRRRNLAHVSTRPTSLLDLARARAQNARLAMAYVVHFLPLQPGDDWVDALERQECEQVQRELEQGDGLADIVRSDWWRIASHTHRVLPEVELRRTKRGLTFVDREHGLTLDVEDSEITLALPYTRDEGRARAALTVAQRIAAFIELETERLAIDAQLGEPFLGSDEQLERAARCITATRLALDRRPEPAIVRRAVAANRDV